ncbi:MAG: ORF6N domain-containing protein [Candidatus Omnitrophica bacterium]|nr:ORF6N domain-containing protein [Candidatus Omnitrophota bacterium]
MAKKKKAPVDGLIPQETIESKILLIRGKKVMLDRDLAKLYGVTTGNFNKAVKRNMKRFPEDFMFQLTDKENDSLRFQIGILKRGRHSKYLPYVFTEQGVAMLSSVLHSERAIQVNIVIMRVFVKLKEMVVTHKDLMHKLAELERKIEKHDEDICTIFEAIRQLMEPPPEKKKGPIGFAAGTSA